MHFREWKFLHFDKKKIHWSLLLRVYWQKNSTGLDGGLAPNRHQANNWTIADPIQWRIYAAQGRDELTQYDN